MPRALRWWSAEHDARLAFLLHQNGMTLRKAADALGVSRSFAQRRTKHLLQAKVQATCTRDREDAGAAPLPPGHPISWGAIALPLPAQC